MSQQTPNRVLLSLLALLSSAFLSCRVGTEIVEPQPSQSWKAFMTSEQIEVVRSVFPDFQPEMFAPGMNLANRSSLTPGNFSPARFFGPADAGGPVMFSDAGVIIETRGFDPSRLPSRLPVRPTYFDAEGRSFNLNLGIVRLSALNKIESRMGLPRTPGGPLIEYDPSYWQVSADEVDRIFLEVRESLALHLPQVRNVPLNNCVIVLAPTIFWVQNSNFGNRWAVGLTDTSATNYVLTLAVFYVNGDRVQNDWRKVLIDEAINFFVLSIGRPDLAI